MFSNSEFKIMMFMLDCGSCHYTDLLNHFIGEISLSEADLLISNLRGNGFLHIDLGKTVSITPQGASALSKAKDERNEKAEGKKDKSFEHKIGVAQCVIPAATFITGLFVERFTGVAEFLLSLIQ